MNDYDDDESKALNPTKKINPITKSSNIQNKTKKKIIFVVFGNAALLLTILAYLLYHHTQIFKMLTCSKLKEYNQVFQQDCSNGCFHCTSSKLIDESVSEQCLRCQSNLMLENSTCVTSCSEGYHVDPFSQCRQSVSQLIQRYQFKSEQATNFSLDYSTHIRSDKVYTFIVILNTFVAKNSLNFNKIFFDSRAHVIELDVPLDLISKFERSCGKNLFSQLFLEEFFPYYLDKFKISQLKNIIFIGSQVTALQAIQMGIHVKQMAYYEKRSKVYSQIFSPHFEVGAIAIEPLQYGVQSFDEFMNSQFIIDEISLLILDGVIPKIKDFNLNTEHIDDFWSYNTEDKEEVLLQYVNFILKKQTYFLTN